MIDVSQMKVRLLILSARPRDVLPVSQFLSKRNYEIMVNGSLRDGVAELARSRPDWVFVSVNLGPLVERFAGLLKESFGVEPILFGDVLDRNTLSRLDQVKGRVLASKLTGPSIQLKISQVLADEMSSIPTRLRMEVRERQTSGVKSAYGHLHLRSGPKKVPLTTTPPAAGGEAAKVMLTAEQEADRDKAARKAVEQLMVMVQEEEGIPGYQVMGFTKPEAELAMKKHKDQLIGPIESLVEEDAADWKLLLSKLVRQNVPGNGEWLTCFVPASDPLPPFKACNADPRKVEVPLWDIPTNVPLPCPLFVHLPRNKKFVCLIKGEGRMSLVQQERLLKSGLQALFILKEDISPFSRFYIRQKLARWTSNLNRPEVIQRRPDIKLKAG